MIDVGLAARMPVRRAETANADLRVPGAAHARQLSIRRATRPSHRGSTAIERDASASAF
jgi:hypothetical protein